MRTTLMVLVVVAGLLAAACGGTSAKPTPPATTAAFSPTTAIATTPATAVTTPAATPTPGPPRVQITGLFSGAPPAGSQPVAKTRTLGPQPPSEFAPWDGTQGVIYDTTTGTEIDLGPSSAIAFSPDSKLAAWIVATPPDTAMVINLASGQRRPFGTGYAAVFLNDGRLAVSQQPGWKLFDATTGQLSADQSIPAAEMSDPGFPSYPVAPAGYHWDVSHDTTTDLPRGGTGKSNYRLVDNTSSATALRFDAVFAAAAGPGEIVVATALDSVMTNIFIVNIATGKAEFIARARYGRGPNWPLSATGRYVLWTENYCHLQDVDPPQGHMQLYDRESKTLTDIADGVPVNSLQEEGLRYGVLTSNNSVGVGAAVAEFGATALFDPATLTWTTVLPSFAAAKQAHQTAWSPDFRYASYSLGGGRGGYC